MKEIFGEYIRAIYRNEDNTYLAFIRNDRRFWVYETIGDCCSYSWFESINNPENIFIKCQIPWYEAHVINENTIDFIYSQAVLEHVEDLESTYSAMRKWLKSSGLMSHTIDFKSHELTKSWNGHWTFSDLEWYLAKGGRKFLINRQPYSKHIELHIKNRFQVLVNLPEKLENNLKKNQISRKFKILSKEDITTSGAYILSKKEGNNLII